MVTRSRLPPLLALLPLAACATAGTPGGADDTARARSTVANFLTVCSPLDLGAIDSRARPIGLLPVDPARLPGVVPDRVREGRERLWVREQPEGRTVVTFDQASRICGLSTANVGIDALEAALAGAALGAEQGGLTVRRLAASGPGAPDGLRQVLSIGPQPGAPGAPRVILLRMATLAGIPGQGVLMMGQLNPVGAVRAAPDDAVPVE